MKKTNLYEIGTVITSIIKMYANNKEILVEKGTKGFIYDHIIDDYLIIFENGKYDLFAIDEFTDYVKPAGNKISADTFYNISIDELCNLIKDKKFLPFKNKFKKKSKN